MAHSAGSMFLVLVAMMLATMCSAKLGKSVEEMAAEIGAEKLDLAIPRSGNGTMLEEMEALEALDMLNLSHEPVGNDTLMTTGSGMKRSLNKLYTRDELEDIAFEEPQEASRIIRGKVVFKAKKAPYVASLYTSTFGYFYSFACTASVVDRRVILSAAHCVSSPALYAVCVSSVTSGRGRCFDALEAWRPTVYDGSDLNGEGNPFTHDIALLKMDGLLVGGTSKAKILPVDFAPHDVGVKGRRGFVYGYGTKNEAATVRDGRLRVVDVFWQKYSRCFNNPFIRSQNFLCANGNYDGSRGGTCRGDSGGPLVWSRNRTQNPGTHVLVGVTSFGPASCDARIPSGFAWVASREHTFWLRAVMKDLLNGRFTVYRR